MLHKEVFPIIKQELASEHQRDAGVIHAKLAPKINAARTNLNQALILRLIV